MSAWTPRQARSRGARFPHVRARAARAAHARDFLERQRAVLYPGLADDVGTVRHRPQARLCDRGHRRQRLPGLRERDGVGPLGSGRPDITDAASTRSGRYGNEDTHYYPARAGAPLAERLLAARPAGLTRVDIALNGTEAVETAMRFMRRATGRPIVIGFMGGYHGETGTAGALGAETSDLSFGYRALLSPRLRARAVPEPVPDALCPAAPGGTGDGTVDYIRDHLLFHAIDPREVAGFMIEPVHGFGRRVAPPDTFWPALPISAVEFDCCSASTR